MATVRNRVRRVLSNVLGVPEDRITEDSSPDTLTGWDSVSQLKLVLALEGEFAVSFSDDDVMDMLSVGLILTILRDKGVTDGPAGPALRDE